MGQRLDHCHFADGSVFEDFRLINGKAILEIHVLEKEQQLVANRMVSKHKICSYLLCESHKSTIFSKVTHCHRMSSDMTRPVGTSSSACSSLTFSQAYLLLNDTS